MKTTAITIIQVYAPNTANSEEEVDDFYDQLQIAINQTSKRDLLIVMVVNGSMQKLDVIGQTRKMYWVTMDMAAEMIEERNYSISLQ